MDERAKSLIVLTGEADFFSSSFTSTLDVSKLDGLDRNDGVAAGVVFRDLSGDDRGDDPADAGGAGDDDVENGDLYGLGVTAVK